MLKRLQDQPSASTEYAGANFQKRPEYFRQFFNLSTRFQWSSMEWKLLHVLEPMGVTYVRMPWSSERFKELYLSEEANPILRYGYDEQLIVRTAYNLTYTNYNRIGRRAMPKIPFRIRSGVEVAGWLPRIVTGLGGGEQNSRGFYEFFKIPYAEYVKGILISLLPTALMTSARSLPMPAIGVAYPYGNSTILPAEKRYFGGGANSVKAGAPVPAGQDLRQRFPRFPISGEE